MTWRNSDLPQDPIGKDVFMGDLRFRITWLYGLQIVNGVLKSLSHCAPAHIFSCDFFAVYVELLVLELPGIAHAISEIIGGACQATAARVLAGGVHQREVGG